MKKDLRPYVIIIISIIISKQRASLYVVSINGEKYIWQFGIGSIEVVEFNTGCSLLLLWFAYSASQPVSQSAESFIYRSLLANEERRKKRA